MVEPNGRRVDYARFMVNDLDIEQITDEGVTTTNIINANGDLASTVDGEGNQRCFSHDAIGKIAATWLLSQPQLSLRTDCRAVGHAPNILRSSHDSYGRVTERFDPEAGYFGISSLTMISPFDRVPSRARSGWSPILRSR